MENSLSILPAEGTTNEFPVLKAFQEYIDAEQAKARKRMLGLSVFFIVLLVVVVVTFVLVLTTVVNRNQALSDRLLDYALKERERAPQVQAPVQPQPPAPVAAPQPSFQELLKPLLERLERQQAEMKASYEKQRAAEVKAEALEAARNEELRKAREDLEKERERTKRENDRQAEIERHLRRLYPDYYQRQSLPAAPAVAPAPRPAPAPQPAAAPANPPPKPAPVRAEPKPETKKPLSTLKPVTYFNTDDDDDVPFLLETPNTPSKK